MEVKIVTKLLPTLLGLLEACVLSIARVKEIYIVNCEATKFHYIHNIKIMMGRLLTLLLLPISSASARPVLWGCRGSPLTTTTSKMLHQESLSAAATELAQMIPRGGASVEEYSAQLEAVKANIIKNTNKAIDDLRRQIVDGGKVVPNFGQTSDTLCNQALQEFAASAPDVGASDADSTLLAATYDRKLQELESILDAPLQVLYLKQLGYLREAALQQFRANAKAPGAVTSSEYEAMLQADAQFVKGAEEATRQSSDWDYSSERAFLQAVMNNIAESGRKATEIQVSSAQQQETAMRFLQSQQQMIQQLQMQLYGQSSPWNVGVAYRIPDTNFNLQGTYQQGRANVQLSCVPDEYAPFLGPSGFTNGVGPGNLGLSLNLSL